MRITGSILNRAGRPQGGLRVVAFDQDLRRAQYLGEAVTNVEGRYRIDYDEQRFARAEKGRADVVVEVQGEGKRVLFRSAVVFNAADDLTLDISLPADADAGPLFNRVEGAVRPLLEGQKLQTVDLEETEKNRDISFLQNETGFAADILAHFVVAQRLGKRSGISPAFFFALIRTDAYVGFGAASAGTVRLSIDLDIEIEPLWRDTLLLDKDAIRARVGEAVERSLVDRSLLRELDAILAKIASARGETKAPTARERIEALARVVEHIGAEAFASDGKALLQDHLGDLPRLIMRLNAAVARGRDAAAKTSSGKTDPGSHLAALLGTHLEVRDQLGVRLSSSPEEVEQLAAREAADWKSALEKDRASARKPEPRDKVHEELAARRFAKATARSHPTAAFAARLAKCGRKDVDSVARVLKMHPEVDLSTVSVERFMKEKGIAASDPPEAKERVRASLKLAQRLYRLSPDGAHARALLEAGHSSAHSVVAKGKPAFLAQMKRVGLSETDAQSIYARAGAIHTGAVLLAGEMRALSGSYDAAAVAPPVNGQSLAKWQADFPNLKTLFAAQDLCACEQCRSVHGPAAYLADVLQFLKARLVKDLTVPMAPASRVALTALLERRPDLGEIDLDCNNALTPLPHIDIVNELLEDLVAPAVPLVYNGPLASGAPDAQLRQLLDTNHLAIGDDAAVTGPVDGGVFYARGKSGTYRLKPLNPGPGYAVLQMRQTHGTAEERSAAPEYINAAAYVALSNAKFAFALPFDAAHSELTTLLEKSNVERTRLMEALGTAAGPAALSIAAQELGLSRRTADLIVNADPANQHQYWNTAPAGAVAKFQVVAAFLDVSGLTYEQLDALLKIPFIDPQDTLFIHPLDSSCDTTQKVIAALDDAALDRLHRFLRLWRATQLDFEMLNLAIRFDPANAAGPLTEPAFTRLAAVTRVARRANLPVDRVLPAYGVGKDGWPASVHRRIFANPAHGPAAAQLDADRIRENEALAPAGRKKIAAVAAPVAVALGVAPAELDILRSLLADDDLTFARLAELYGAALVARAAGLRAGAYSALRRLTSIDPVSTPQATLEFLDAAEALKRAGVEPDPLLRVLSFDAARPNLSIPADAALTTLLQDIQAAQVAARAAWLSPFDAALDITANTDALLQFLARLPQATPQILAGFDALARNKWPAGPETPTQFLTRALGSTLGAAALASVQAAWATVAAAPVGGDLAQRTAFVQATTDEVSKALQLSARYRETVSRVARSARLDEVLAETILKGGHLKQVAGQAGKTLDQILMDDALITPVGGVLPAINAAAFPNHFHALRLVAAIAGVVPSFKFTGPELQWLFATAAAAAVFEPDTLPTSAGQAPVAFGTVLKWLRLRRLAESYPPAAEPALGGATVSIYDVVAAALAPGAVLATVLARLAVVTGWPSTQLSDLDARFGFSAVSVAKYGDVDVLTRLESVIGMLRTLGASVSDAALLIKDLPDLADCAVARTLLRSRFEAADWLPVQRQIMNVQRAARRDALVSWLLSNDARFASVDSLYDYLLIDTQLAPCEPTSRIVQAHGTVQLFVERCRLGIEQGTVADTAEDIGWDQWSWMANYRVWEANRKVFLWPENWIEPELRDDKSHLFRQMEDALSQNELTNRLAEDTLQTYIEVLDDIGFLHHLALTFDPITGDTHIFARTRGGDPATHYYRRLHKEREWTPWEPVDLDIGSDQLVPFVRNRRLYLAWPVFEEEAEQKESVAIPASGGGDAESANKRLRIRLAVSEYNGSKWLPRKISKDALVAGSYAKSTIPPAELRFLPLDLAAAGFMITVTRAVAGADGYFGAFSVTGCKGYPEPTRAYASWLGLLILPVFKDTAVLGNRPTEQGGDTTNDFAIQTLPFPQSQVQLFANTPDGNAASSGSGSASGAASASFKVAQALQMTALDRMLTTLSMLFLPSNMKYAAAEYAHRYTMPMLLGTALPFFFEDHNRVYAIVPTWHGRAGSGNALVEKTASDVIPMFETLLERLAWHWSQTLAANKTFFDFLLALMNDADFVDAFDEAIALLGLDFGYAALNAFHPLVCTFRRVLNERGLPGLMSRETQQSATGFVFDAAGAYEPTPSVLQPYPVEDVSFRKADAYAGYNWEIFYHLPFLMARKLSANQRFEEAMRWYHFIFDPTGSQGGTPPQRYWVTKPFYERLATDYAEQRIEDILYRTANDPAGTTLGDIADSIEDWRARPFMPFVVARSRTVAFQKAVVIRYIENLIAWADSLYRQETRESIVRASQLYMLALKLLGPKPRLIPPVATPRPATYNELKADLDLFSNALVEMENLVPEPGPLPDAGEEPPPAPFTLTSLYFCVPPNDKLLAFWSLLDARLENIRNCRTIDGAERTLALFSPPIDPGALVRAAASGAPLSSVLSSLNAPLPPYRFEPMLQRAVEFIQEVRTLGNALLQALDRRDGEDLALLRSTLEIALLEKIKEVRKRQVDEAVEQGKAIQRQIDVVRVRQSFYRSRKAISDLELVSLVLQGVSAGLQGASAALSAVAGVVNLLPNLNIGLSGFGGSPHVTVQWGSTNVAGGLSSFASAAGSAAGAVGTAGAIVSTMAAYERRMDEWRLQGDIADAEISQLQQQAVANNVREDILRKEQANHLQQIENARTVDAFMRSKFTNRELHAWLAGEISAVYFQAYDLAFRMARKAERCFQHELGTSDTFMEQGSWDSLRKGLGSAERLMQQVRRMESAWYERNGREFELTRHVSLAQLDAVALLDLRTNGACTVSIPEAMYDVDYPGHYMRRIKSVAVTIPCVAGPQATVACKLTLVSNKYRRSPEAANAGAYPENDGQDERFVYNVGGVQSITTSQAQNDSGLFEVNLQSDRWLPFERCGAAGTWRIELGSSFRSFDRNTVRDVIFHIRYTARDGGARLKTSAEGALAAIANQIGNASGTAGLLRLIDVRAELPDVWRRLTTTGSAPVRLERMLLPFLASLRNASVTDAWLLVKPTGPAAAAATFDYSIDGVPFSAAKDAMVAGIWSNKLPNPLPVALDTPFALASANADKLESLHVLVRYSV